ncbi:hypothetical protein GCM10027273_10070 [Nocardioides pakistanensis]
MSLREDPAHPSGMSITQSRVAAGVPTGGQFAASVHAEADVALVAPDTVAYGDVYEDEAADHERFAALLDMAEHSARHWAERKGTRDRSGGAIDTDDVAQDAVLAYLEAQANGHEIKSPQGYIHRAASNIAASAGSRVRAEDRKALVLFRDEVSRQEAAKGRQLSGREKDAIAQTIRDTWPDERHQPSKNFRRFAGQMEISMDAYETDEARDYVLPHTDLNAGLGVNDVRPESSLDKALDAVEGHNGDLRDARRLLWNALAEINDAPTVRPGTLSQRKVTALRAEMSAYPGGVATAARNWADGIDDQGTHALFAPWGEPNDRDRADIVALLGKHPDAAEAMWDSALKLANTRNAARV